MNNNYKDKLKKIKYRCQTLGIKELDVIFERIYSKLVNTNDEALIDQLDDLLKNETQYIFDVFFNESFKEDRIKYLKIINLSKDTNYNEITNMYSKLLQYEPRKVISI